MTEEKISKIQSAWNSLSSGNLDSLGKIYSADIQYQDPISSGQGLDNLKKHFGRIFRGLSKSTYTYRGSTFSSDIIVMEWTLHAELRASKKALELPGISWLNLNPESGKIERSREYFDLGKGLYEQIPLMGNFMKRIKRYAFR